MSTGLWLEHMSRRLSLRRAFREALGWTYDPIGAYVDLDAIYSSTHDPNARDGEWHMIVTLPHEVGEQDGYGVPVFEGDVERIEWERNRRKRWA